MQRDNIRHNMNIDILRKINTYFLNEDSNLISHLKKNGNKMYHEWDDLYKKILGAMSNNESSFKSAAHKFGIDIKAFTEKDGRKKFVVKIGKPEGEVQKGMERFLGEKFYGDTEKYRELINKLYLNGSKTYLMGTPIFKELFSIKDNDKWEEFQVLAKKNHIDVDFKDNSEPGRGMTKYSFIVNTHPVPKGRI